MKDPVVTMFFAAIPLAKILRAVMDGTYDNPDYEKYLEEKREIDGNERFKEMCP